VVALRFAFGMSAPLSVSRWSALVVHGDAAVRNLTRVVLEWAGAHVLEVGSGAAALTALDHGHFGNAMGASELFGHRRGAFTGAVADVRGKLEEAQGGTVFLDEVGDLQPDAQAQLLRVLQDGTYWRLGDPTPRHADVRILAATNRDLEADVLAGRFREDLFHRLDVVTLTLLPLRERREDVLTERGRGGEGAAREGGGPGVAGGDRAGAHRGRRRGHGVAGGGGGGARDRPADAGAEAQAV
jgi:CheY-like chemotaxis protein